MSAFSVGLTFPRLVETVPPLSVQVAEASRVLAQRIEDGEYAELMPHQRCDLRQLAMEISGWSDHIETIETERLPRRRPAPYRIRLAFWRWFYSTTFWRG